MDTAMLHRCTIGFSQGRFDVTECTESIFTSFALLLLAVFGPLELWRLRQAAPRQRDDKKLRIQAAKSALIVVLLLLQAAFLIYTAVQEKELSSANISRLAFIIVTPLSILISRNAFRKLQRSSTILLMFWLLVVVIDIIRLRTDTLTSTRRNRAVLALQSVILATEFVIFALECIGPEPSGGRIALPTDEDDDEIDYTGREAPILKANIFSRLVFEWMTPMMVQGYKKNLDETDLWALRREDQADALGNTFGHYWDIQRQKTRDGRKKKPSVWISLTQAYGMPYLVAAVFKAVQDILAFLQPQLLKRLLNFVDSYRTDSPEPAYHGYTIAVIMFICAIAQSFALHQYFARCFETSMRVRGGLIHAIYKKSLVLSNEERSGRTTGDIVNLQSTDATRMADLMVYGQTIWSGSFQLILAFVSLYSLLGFYGLFGVAVMIVSIPLNSFVARLQARLQKKQMANKDQRSRIMNEILNNIRTIKLACWENAFAQRLFAIRNDKELVLLRRMGYLSSISTFLWTLSPFLVGFATFASYAIFSKTPLTSQIVFPALSLFQLITFPLAVLPNVITSWVEAFVSSERLVSFLDANELQSDAVKYVPYDNIKAGDELVKIDQGSFAWTRKAVEPTLSNIDLSLKKGGLIAVVGRVGTGKSSLLSAILGEMSKLSGQVTVRGSIAYVSQTAWIANTTVKDNITFGARFDPDFYEIVLQACALKEDLAILPQGDMSEVGEKGLSLSGGQKARLSLARAVYSRADIFLFDDPLSAVDAHVGRHIFDRVMGPNGLLKTKARLLCTNAITFVQQADEIVMLRAGTVIERGLFDPTKADSEIAKLLNEYGKQDSDDDSEDSGSSQRTAVQEDKRSTPSPDQGDQLEEKKIPEIIRKGSTGVMRRASMLNVRQQKAELFRSLKHSSKPKEHREVGSVNKRHYIKYIRANGVFGVVLYISTILLNQAFTVGTAVWLKHWAQYNAVHDGNANQGYFLGIYLALGLATALISLVNGLLLYALCVIRSAKELHDGMFNAVMRSPMQFFETTPIGTVLNRFSRDIYVIDEMLARVFGGFFRTGASVLGIVIVVSTALPLYMVVIIPVIIVYRYVQKYYLATSRELKRLDATTKSPIFASFSETLNGLATIRAFGQQRRFLAENESRLDRNQECYFPSVSCNRWLAVRLELMGSFLIFAAAVLSVISLTSGGAMDAGLVGVIISFSLNITGSLNWMVRSATEVETNIVSVERCMEYSELKPEAPLQSDNEPKEEWPQGGAIEFKNYSARYRENLDLVLRGVNLDIKAGEKVGICGRTGAGKSSLSMCLFRIIEPASGTIVIDGVDVTNLGLHELRSKISIIPQDASMFEGTLRDNLDPVGDHPDDELWRALEQSALKEHAQQMGGLDAKVDEGGSNLSSGQRQLLCLARALLKNSKILVLDEATAAIDVETDKAVQVVIREAFADCTILTVAHRLNTIMDSDRILVMDKGRVAEFDEPRALLNKPNSIFFGLAQEAGVGRSSAAPSRQPSPPPE